MRNIIGRILVWLLLIGAWAAFVVLADRDLVKGVNQIVAGGAVGFGTMRLVLWLFPLKGGE